MRNESRRRCRQRRVPDEQILQLVDHLCAKPSCTQRTGEQATSEQATGEQATGEQATGERATGEQATGAFEQSFPG